MGSFINFNIRGDQFTISEKSIESAAKTQQKETSSVKTLIKGIASKVLHRTNSTGVKDGNLNQPQHAGLVQLKSKLEHLQQAIKDHTESIKEIQSQPGTPLTYLLNSQKSNLESLKKEWQETKTGLEKLNSLEQKYNFPHATLMTEINGIAKTIDDLAQPILNHGAAVAKPEVAPKEAAPQKNEGLTRLKNIFRRSSDPTSSAPRPVTAKTIESDIKAILKSKKPIEEKRAELSQKLLEFHKLSKEAISNNDAKTIKQCEKIQSNFEDDIHEQFKDDPFHKGFAVACPDLYTNAVLALLGAINDPTKAAWDKDAGFKDLESNLVLYDKFTTGAHNIPDHIAQIFVKMNQHGGDSANVRQQVKSKVLLEFKSSIESKLNDPSITLKDNEKAYLENCLEMCDSILKTDLEIVSDLFQGLLTGELKTNLSELKNYHQATIATESFQGQQWDLESAQLNTPSVSGGFVQGELLLDPRLNAEAMCVGKIGQKEDGYNGDGVHVAMMSNGARFAAVVDAAGNSKNSAEGTVRVLEAVSSNLTNFTPDLEKPDEIQSFVTQTMIDGHRACIDGDVECTLNMNMLVPLEGNRSLLITTSSGDGFTIIKRKNGTLETVTPLDPELKGKKTENDKTEKKQVEDSCGALGNNDFTNGRILDIKTTVLEEGDVVIAGSDVLRDNWGLLKPELENCANGEELSTVMNTVFYNADQAKILELDKAQSELEKWIGANPNTTPGYKENVQRNSDMKRDLMQLRQAYQNKGGKNDDCGVVILRT